MKNYRRLLVVLLAGFAGQALDAANKAEKTDRVVDAVLEQETKATVARRSDDLGDLIGQSDRARWAAGYVKTADGWHLFDALPPHDERLREYEQRRGTEPLSPEQHLALASWCREQRLMDQSRAHVWAVLASHPDSSELWQRLGYESVNGSWMTLDERRRMGEEQRELAQGFRLWTARAQSLATRLSDRNPGTQASARTDLNSIQDLTACPALESHLSKASADSAMSLIVWLNERPQIGTTFALIRQSLDSPWREVRTMAADSLRHRRLDQTMPPLLYALSTPVNLTVNQSSHPVRTGSVLVSAVVERESWNTIERRKYAVRIGSELNLSIGIRRGLTSVSRQPWRPELKDQNDLDRFQKELQQNLTQNRNEVNRQIMERNERAGAVLAQITGLTEERTPREWWSSWSTLTATEPPIAKSVVEVSEKETVITPPPKVHLHSSCLPAGTPVMTASGGHPIESLQIGDIVLAKDIDTGELSYKPVIRTTVRSPQPLVTLHTQDDSIRATLGHYFWVSGKGWRMAKEIKTGDRLHGVHGTATVTDISPGGREAVYNLVVEGANTYFVGNGHLLSHDVTPPVPTDIVVPGLAAR